jgi:hypothetical protein
MASELCFVEFIVDQIENAGIITYKKMFGEYAIYSDSKVVALVCDNQLRVDDLLLEISLRLHHTQEQSCLFLLKTKLKIENGLVI